MPIYRTSHYKCAANPFKSCYCVIKLRAYRSFLGSDDVNYDDDLDSNKRES